MRNLRLSAALIASTLLVVGTSAKATVITFDSIDASGGPVAVTSQFAGLGVTFSDLYVIENVFNNFSSAPNAGIINDEFPFSLLVTATFAADVTDVSALFSDTNVGTNLVTMKAFNASDALLGMTTVTTPAAQMATVGLSFAGIRKITLETDPDGTLFDDFTFTPSITVPEPGTLTLFGFGLAGLGFARRRRVA